MRLEQCRLVRHFRLRNTADQMGPHIVRLRRRGVVGVTADVEVVAVGLQRRVVHDGREALDSTEFVEGGDDLLDVLRQQVVLRAALEKLAVGVDEENLAPALRRFPADAIGALLHALAKDKDRSRNLGAIEQVWRDADHGLQEVGLNDAGTNRLLLLLWPRRCRATMGPRRGIWFAAWSMRSGWCLRRASCGSRFAGSLARSSGWRRGRALQGSKTTNAPAFLLRRCFRKSRWMRGQDLNL